MFFYKIKQQILYYFKFAFDHGSDLCSFELARYILFDLKRSFMNFREIFWFPFCPHHGKSDTDRMFRVLRQFVTVWIRTYTLEEAKELRTCFVKSVKINNEIRKSKGKSTKVSKFHFFYKFEQKIESYTQKVLRHSNCQIFTEIFSTRSLGLRSRTSVLPYLYTSTFE